MAQSLVAAKRKRIARQQWRARIETARSCQAAPWRGASPASNGGRGLKRLRHSMGVQDAQCIARQQWRARIETRSAASRALRSSGIARQQWRARIETTFSGSLSRKPCGIARQQWRARIETFTTSKRKPHECLASPASNGGRGLKRTGASLHAYTGAGIARQQWRARIETTSCWRCWSPRRRIARQQWRARIETRPP